MALAFRLPSIASGGDQGEIYSAKEPLSCGKATRAYSGWRWKTDDADFISIPLGRESQIS